MGFERVGPCGAWVGLCGLAARLKWLRKNSLRGSFERARLPSRAGVFETDVRRGLKPRPFKALVACFGLFPQPLKSGPSRHANSDPRFFGNLWGRAIPKSSRAGAPAPHYLLQHFEGAAGSGYGFAFFWG